MAPSKADAPYADLSTFQDSGACPNPFKMAAHQDATAILRPGCPSSAPLPLPMPGPVASEWTWPGPGSLEIEIPKKGIEIPKKGIGLSKWIFFGGDSGILSNDRVQNVPRCFLSSIIAKVGRVLIRHIFQPVPVCSFKTDLDWSLRKLPIDPHIILMAL